MPLNELQKKVLEFVKQHEGFAREKTDKLLSELSIKTDDKSIGKIVDKIYGGTKYGNELKTYLMAGTIDAVSIGAGVTIRGKAKVNSFKAWYTEYAYKPWGSTDKEKWSERVNNLNRVAEIKSDIRASIKAGQSMQQAAQFLHDKGIQKADVAKDIQKIIDKARTLHALSDDSEGYIKFKSEVVKVQKRINTLTRQDTSKLRRAYQDILDLTNTSSAAQVERAIKYTSYFKERYNAERIARTEMGRAYGDAVFTDAAYNDDVIGIKFMLSSGHEVPDICCHPDTKILGEKTKKISEIKIGDLVLTHTGELKPVEKVYITKKENLKLVSFVSTLSGELYRVKLTHNHPILTEKGFVPVSDLKMGCLGIFENGLSDEKHHQRVCGDNRKGRLNLNRNGIVQSVGNIFLLLCGVLKGLLIYHTSRIFYFLSHLKPSKVDKNDLNFYDNSDIDLPSNSDYSLLFDFLKISNGYAQAYSTSQHGVSQSLGYFLHAMEHTSYRNESALVCQKSFFDKLGIFFLSLRGVFCSNPYYKMFFQFQYRALISNVFHCKLGKVLQIFQLLFPLKPPLYFNSDIVKSYIKYSLIASKSQVAFIANIQDIKNNYDCVYNLAVKDNNTYFADGLLVHNCDLHTGADMYGMGEGVYPKEYAPSFPFHPSCLCACIKVFEGEVDKATKEDYDPNGGKKYLASLPAEKQKEILGAKGQRNFKDNPKQWDKAMKKKGWLGHEDKKATIPKKVLYG